MEKKEQKDDARSLSVILLLKERRVSSIHLKETK